ncbi:MAG TPA: hypothetical protein VKF38_13025, partial [Anaerolineaceae bacterium]|nr:hypothetical protein [Anaerolineaceae bacterium]
SDGDKIAFDSNADDLTINDPDPGVSNIYLSINVNPTTKPISRIAGWDGVDDPTYQCAYTPDRCNSNFPVISRKPQADSNNSIYDIVFSSAANITHDDFNGKHTPTNNNFPYNYYYYKGIFLAKVDVSDPANPRTTFQRVSVGLDANNNIVAENGDSGYLDRSLLTPTNVLHPVADVYEAGGGDVNGAQSGDAVVVFESDASNLLGWVGGKTVDANNHKDIFLRDMGNGTTTPGNVIRLTNKGYDGKEPNGDSSDPVITDDGKYLAFVSTATNLVPGATSGIPQIYLLDITTHTFYLVSRDVNNISTIPGNGESRYPSIIETQSGAVKVAFHSTSTNLASGANNGIANIYVYTLDKLAQTPETLDLVSRGSSADINSNSGPIGNMDSLTPYLSSDGGAVTFSSYADNLVEGANNYDCLTTLHGQQITKCKDIYTTDLSAHQTWRVSLTSSGEQAQSNSAFPALSGDGRFVSFTSYVDIFGTGHQTDHMQIYQRDQGIPLGNPVIQPSSWNFFAQENNISIRTFTVTSLINTTKLQSDDNSYTGLLLVQGAQQGSSTDNFSILLPNDPQNTLYCTGASAIPKGSACTFQVIYTATDMTGKQAILYVGINDDRKAVAISLQGRTVVSYFPLMFVH